MSSDLVSQVKLAIRHFRLQFSILAALKNRDFAGERNNSTGFMIEILFSTSCTLQIVNLDKYA